MGIREMIEKAAELRMWVQLPPSPLLSPWVTTALNSSCFEQQSYKTCHQQRGKKIIDCYIYLD
jgi:hypothetical protein